GEVQGEVWRGTGRGVEREVQGEVWRGTGRGVEREVQGEVWRGRHRGEVWRGRHRERCGEGGKQECEKCVERKEMCEEGNDGERGVMERGGGGVGSVLSKRKCGDGGE
ncbi:hypothetical protein EMCRGX_G015686, partial [Ephydatia muelleri]